MGGVTGLLAEGERGGVLRALVLVDVVPRRESTGVDRIGEFMMSAPSGFARAAHMVVGDDNAVFIEHTNAFLDQLIAS